MAIIFCFLFQINKKQEIIQNNKLAAKVYGANHVPPLTIKLWNLAVLLCTLHLVRHDYQNNSSYLFTTPIIVYSHSNRSRPKCYIVTAVSDFFIIRFISVFPASFQNTYHKFSILCLKNSRNGIRSIFLRNISICLMKSSPNSNFSTII